MKIKVGLSLILLGWGTLLHTPLGWGKRINKNIISISILNTPKKVARSLYGNDIGKP